MVEFCIDNICVEFGGHIYISTLLVGCASLVADLFLYSYKDEKSLRNKITQSFYNINFRYIYLLSHKS